MNLFYFLLIILLPYSIILGQPIPNNHFLYKSSKILYDAGKDWESLTIFGPIRFKSKSQNIFNDIEPSTDIDKKIGFNISTNIYALSGYYHFKHDNKYYGYSYPIFLSKKNKNQKTGTMPQSINIQNGQSGIGLENNWAILQIGKGRESWGAGSDIQLSLSENSGTYDYFLLGSDYGKVRVRYIHGFLENIDTNINRYITARGFELTNKKSFIIGFSETVIYSGLNRSMDIAYFNPMSSHLEIELNNRLNVIGNDNANAVWQLHLDYHNNKQIRFSANYLYDEFVIDQEIEEGKEHGKAYSMRLAYNPLFSKNHILTIYTSLVHIGTPTFRHSNGMNNFVQSERPLGWYRGSDGQEICFGINYFNYIDLLISFSTGFFQTGEETITNRVFEPYENYLSGLFPSGEIEKNYFIESQFTYWLNDNLSITNAIYFSPDLILFDLKINVQLF